MMSSSNDILIDLNDVTKTYKTGAGQVTVLDNVSLRVRTGEFMSVVGPSGAGKSTLLNMIAGIDKPTSGEVIIAGQSIHTMAENALAQWRGRNIGVVFQFFQLLPTLTLLENVVLPMDFCRVYPKRAREKRAMELLELVEIAEHAHKLPHMTSGGEQQRAAIARALANDPSVIIADEPTGNLDSKTANGLIALFNQLCETGKTLLIVTHDLGLSDRTQRIVHLRDGAIDKITTPEWRWSHRREH